MMGYDMSETQEHATPEERIRREVARAQELAGVREAARRLSTTKVEVKNLRHLELPDDVRADLASLVNRIEDSLWRLEQHLLEKRP